MASLVAAALAFAGCERRSVAPGTVIVGSSPTGVPFSFIDPWTVELTGALVDTIHVVAKQAALPIDLRVTPFSALIPSLLAHKIDLIAAAMLHTPERERVVAFTDRVFVYGGGLAVLANDTRHFRNLESLRDLRVGGQVGTRFIDQLRAAGIERIRTYDNLSDMTRDVLHGRIDAAYGDKPILAYQLRVGARPGLRLVTEFEAPAREELCFVLRHGDPLIARLNSAIGVLRPQLGAIFQHWGLSE